MQTNDVEKTASSKGFQKGLGRAFGDILLLLIGERPIHGYELPVRLKEFDIDFPEGVGQMGRIYRVLSEFEKKGLVLFTWDTLHAPPRKIYRITDKGREYLNDSVEWAQNYIHQLEQFVNRADKVAQ